MSKSETATDSIQQRLTSYACDLTYDSLSSEAIHAAKVRIIDTLGSLMGGFFGEPCLIARNLAAQMPNACGATIMGTTMKTTPDLAAFVNATTACYPAMTDSYHWPGSSHGHPSDTVMPVLAAAEHAQVSGRDFITGIVLAYEVFCRISDVFRKSEFHNTNLCVVGSAVAAGKLLGLTSKQLSHCISMAVVPNIILKRATIKAVAAAQAGRAGVFAALLARAGMEGPHLPFEGRAGWCDYIAQTRFSLNVMGGGGVPFKIVDTQIKNRPAGGAAIACILAAEKIAPVNVNEIKEVTVELYKFAKERTGTDPLVWNPTTPKTADFSAPYLVATTLVDGTVTLRSYNDAHLWNPQVRALMKKIKIVENTQFTHAFERKPPEHRARVTVVADGGELLVGETGGDEDDLSAPKSDSQIEKKFRGLTEDMLTANQVKTILDRLWHLEDLANVAEIVSALVVH